MMKGKYVCKWHYSKILWRKENCRLEKVVLLNNDINEGATLMLSRMLLLSHSTSTLMTDLWGGIINLSFSWLAGSLLASAGP
jgi:hypothetical protein